MTGTGKAATFSCQQLKLHMPAQSSSQTRLFSGALPPREGGLHDRWSDCTDSCHGEAASLVIGCNMDPAIPYGLLYLSVRIVETLAIGND